MFKNILVGYDGSAHSTRALSYAQDLAQKYDAQLILAYAFYPLPTTMLGAPYAEQLQSHALSAGKDIIKEAQDKLADSKIKVTAELLEGPPAEALLRIAETHQCDLIVLGSRGLGTLKASLLGSVSDKVLHHSSVPVLITR